MVLGDPHGDLVGLELVLERESKPGTAIVSAGDNVGYADARSSSYLCELLRDAKIPSVLGNHEAWCLESGRLQISPPELPRDLSPDALAWCRALPERIDVEAAAWPEAKVAIVHTLPDWAYVDVENAERLAHLHQARITFCGHTHHPAIYTLAPGKRTGVRRLDPRSAMPVELSCRGDARYVVDAGSLARPTNPRRRMCPQRGTYAVLDFEKRTLGLHSLDKGPRMRQLMREWVQ